LFAAVRSAEKPFSEGMLIATLLRTEYARKK
jgi:hypothetical protein